MLGGRKPPFSLGIVEIQNMFARCSSDLRLHRESWQCQAYTPDWRARGTVSAEVPDAPASRAAFSAPRSLRPPYGLVFGAELLPFWILKNKNRRTVTSVDYPRHRTTVAMVRHYSPSVRSEGHGHRRRSWCCCRWCAARHHADIAAVEPQQVWFAPRAMGTQAHTLPWRASKYEMCFQNQVKVASTLMYITSLKDFLLNGTDTPFSNGKARCNFGCGRFLRCCLALLRLGVV